MVRVDGHRRPHPDGQHDLHFAGAVRHLRGEADRARLLRPRGPEPSAAPVTGVPTPPTAQRPTAPVSRAAEAEAAVGPDGGDAPAVGPTEPAGGGGGSEDDAGDAGSADSEQPRSAMEVPADA